MSCRVIMPSFGYEKGDIVKWYKQDGEFIERGEALVIVETEKAAFDLYAPCSGRVKIHHQEGESVGTGEVIVTIQ